MRNKIVELKLPRTGIVLKCEQRQTKEGLFLIPIFPKILMLPFDEIKKA